MIEFADPALVACLGTFGGAMLLKGGEVLLKKRKVAEVDAKARAERIMDMADPEENRVEALAQAILTDDSFGGCTLEFQRAFEQKYIDAGIHVELSKCYDERCETCHPPKTEAPEVGTTPHRQRYLESRRKQRDANAYSREETARKFLAKMEYQNSRSGAQRVAEVSGRMVPIPNNVPKDATGSYMYSSMTMQDGIRWEWEVDGNPMYIFVGLDSRMFDEFPMAPVFKNLVAQEYAEEQIKNIMELPPSIMSPEPYNEVCFNCNYEEVEVDMLLDAPVVFRSDTCPDHAKVNDLWIQ